MVLGEYARHPLTVYELEDGRQGREVAEVVSDQLYLHLGASFGFDERLQLSVDFPVAVVNRGDAAAAQGVTLAAPSGGALGDLRGGIRFRLFGERDAPIGAAIGGYVFIPAGDDTQFTSTGRVRGNPNVILGGRAGALRWGVNTGVMIQERAAYGNTRLGTSLTFGGGVALVTAKEAVQIGPELYGSTLLDKSGQPGALPAFDTKDTNLEAILGIKGRLEPIVSAPARAPASRRASGRRSSARC